MNQIVKRAFLDTEDGQILYRIAGEGEPLLLLHLRKVKRNERHFFIHKFCSVFLSGHTVYFVERYE